MSNYEVKTAETPESTLEKKHIPLIEAPDTVTAGEFFEVTVKIGDGIDHPVDDDHFIQYIELYADYYQVGRLTLTPEMKAEATFKIKLEESCTLRAFEFCNLHGQWEAKQEITVE